MANDRQPPIDHKIEDSAIKEPLADNQDTNTLDIDQALIDSDPFADKSPFAAETVANNQDDTDVIPAEIELSNQDSAETLSDETTLVHRDDVDTPRLNGLDDLPIELLFITEKIKTTLKEVKQIKKGYVFELNKSAVGQVEIYANGTLVGSGELVQIEDQAGVRVLKLHHQEKGDE